MTGKEAPYFNQIDNHLRIQMKAEKEKAALEPIIKKAQDAIKAIAKTKGFVYVLDSKALIVSEGEDLGPAVKTKLGIQ